MANLLNGLLNHEEKMVAVQGLDGWVERDDRDALAKTFRFKDFNVAFAWMTRVAMRAEKMDHHPEWFNLYNRVEVVLATHSAGNGGGGITQLDIDLAAFMDAVS